MTSYIPLSKCHSALTAAGLLLSGLFAVAKTPDVIIKRLNQETVRAPNQADVKDKLLNAGAEVLTMLAQLLRLRFEEICHPLH